MGYRLYTFYFGMYVLTICVMDKFFTKMRMRYVKNKWRKLLVNIHKLAFLHLPLRGWRCCVFLLHSKCDILTSKLRESSGTGITYAITHPGTTFTVTQNGFYFTALLSPLPKPTAARRRAPASAALARAPWQTWPLRPSRPARLPEAAVDAKTLQLWESQRLLPKRSLL